MMEWRLQDGMRAERIGEPKGMVRRNRVMPLASLAMLAALVAGAGCTGQVPLRLVDDCALDGNDAENERSPGYPYDFQTFKQDIAPVLAADCATGGCHGEAEPPAGSNGGFVVFAGADVDSCARVKTFKEFRDKVDLTTPAASRMIFALEGGELTGNVRHPLDYTASEDGQAALDAIVAFIEQASATCVAGGGCAPDVRDYFDLARFQDEVQPGLDAAGCSAAGCHQPPDGQRGFALPASPERDSPEMQASYDAVTSRISLDADPRATLLFVKATQSHSGSTAIDQQTADALVAWIAAAVAARGDGDDLGCANPAQLDLAVFRDEILPILRGDVNLNPGGDQGIATGCTREPCHGQPRPGSLMLIPTDPPEMQLANFACFVSLTSPVSSQVLLCPRNHPGCAKSPHPGDQLLVGVDDLNYQRLLSFLFSAVTEVTPLDLAFYVRRIEPMFDDRGAVEGSAVTCADTSQCHGIAAAGGAAPNGANLAIIRGPAGDMNRLKANFTEASAFINFLSPDQSSLFLYPTNEIANLDNPAATGFDHPGGADFAADSSFAQNILTFAQGLRPDSDGFQRSWLVAGAYPGSGGTGQETSVDEETVTPIILDESVGTALAGKWDALFEEGPEVDIARFLGGEVGSGRVAYAVSYLYNTTATDLDLDVELSSQGDARFYVGDDRADVAAGETFRVALTIGPSRASEAPTGTRILVKLFDDPARSGMSFSVRLFHAGTNRVLDGQTRELIVKLGPRGGV
jgi:hypothetical protein